MTRGPFLHVMLAAALFIAVLVAYIFWYDKVSGMQEEVAALTAEAESAAESAGEIAAARAALSRIAADEEYFGSYFVSTSTVVSYLEGMEATGDVHGALVEVVSVTPQGSTRLAVSFRATGSFAAVMRTVGAIEHGPYDATMVNMNLETNAASEGKWTATGAISVGMTAAKEEAPKPAAPQTDDLTI